ncbi:MAG: hypothetical protein C0456_13850 [Hyphomonas sp.]|uniref:ThiF family adenylyltransferase n=1 Tax=Hyphomonas sp. TaxID=87 RepID=UPI001DE8C974|nr:hypothetical protein [Hyphomonas sp.]
MINRTDALWQIRTTLSVRGFIPDKLDPRRFVGTLVVGHHTIDVVVEVPDLDFIQLPRVHLQNRHQLPWDVIAHQRRETGICYGLQGHYSLDPAFPGAAILRVLADCVKALLSSAKGRGAEEAAREYAAYWGGPSVCLISPLRQGTRLTAYRRNVLGRGPNSLLASSQADLPQGYASLKKQYTVVELPGPAQPAGEVLVPSRLSDLFKWLSSLGADAGVERTCIQAMKDSGGIVISASNGLYGVDLHTPALLAAIKGPRANFFSARVKSESEKIEIERFQVSPADLGSVVTRSLPVGSATLSERNVCLVGCGAIGGHLAKLLAQLGAGHKKSLSLIDPDLLTAGNIGRHALGFEYVGQWKSEAVAAELAKFHPQISTKAVVGTVADHLAALSRCDLVVDATGVENVASQLNRFSIERRGVKHPPVLFHVHLFGYGIAAQSFANLGSGYACYRCLRPDRSQSWRHDPKLDVRTEDDPVDGGCGDGAFLPYGPYASSAAASLSAQHIHDWAQGRNRSTLRTLTLDPDRGRQIAPTTPTVHEHCPECQ